MDLVARPGMKVLFVKRRQAKSPVTESVNRGDEVLYEDGVEELELDVSEGALESDEVCCPCRLCLTLCMELCAGCGFLVSFSLV